MKNKDQPIHPVADLRGQKGLTKREHFAGLILPALLSKTRPDYITRDAVSDAVIIADLLLKELEQ